MAEESKRTSHNSQYLGEVHVEGGIYTLNLRKIYCDIDETQENRLLWTTEIERTIQAGTLSCLVQQLSPLKEEVDQSYWVCFLAVYRTFTTPYDLLTNLIDRYISHLNCTEYEEITHEKQQKCLKSILSFIKLWIDKYTEDFNCPPSFPELLMLETFLKDQLPQVTHHLLQELTELHRQVSTCHQKLSTAAMLSEQLCVCGHGGCDGSNKHYHWLYKPAELVAQDLTALDAEIFKDIIPYQCLHYVRHDKNKSPTILCAIDTFNKLTQQVLLSILEATDSKKMKTPLVRGQAISHWIDIAHFCRLLKNFSSLKAITSGLESSAIYRLKRSWEMVPNDKKVILTELHHLLSYESNFQVFRDVLDKEATGKRVAAEQSPKKPWKQIPEIIHGVVPYLGTFLTDLTMLHSALPDICSDGLINFEKRRKEFEILAKLSLFQTAASKYPFPLKVSLIHLLHTSPVMSDQESFLLSKKIEATPSPVGSHTSPSHLITPPCQILLQKSLQLFAKVAVGDITSTDINVQPKRLSVDLLKVEEEEQPSLHRSSSCQELQDYQVVRVSMTGSNSCNYKSIMISRCDHTAAVIKAALEKYDLTADPSSYELVQQLKDKGELKIPAGTSVYYALDNNIKEIPLLILKLKHR